METGIIAASVLILVALFGLVQFAQARRVAITRRVVSSVGRALMASCRYVNPWWWMPCVVVLRHDRIEIERGIGGPMAPLLLDKIGRIEVDEYLRNGKSPPSGAVLRITHLRGILEFVSDELDPWKDWAMSFQGADLNALRGKESDGVPRAVLDATPRKKGQTARKVKRPTKQVVLMEPEEREEQAAEPAQDGRHVDVDVIARLSRRLGEESAAQEPKRTRTAPAIGQPAGPLSGQGPAQPEKLSEDVLRRLASRLGDSPEAPGHEPAAARPRPAPARPVAPTRPVAPAGPAAPGQAGPAEQPPDAKAPPRKLTQEMLDRLASRLEEKD